MNLNCIWTLLFNNKLEKDAELHKIRGLIALLNCKVIY